MNWLLGNGLHWLLLYMLSYPKIIFKPNYIFFILLFFYDNIDDTVVLYVNIVWIWAFLWIIDCLFCWLLAALIQLMTRTKWWVIPIVWLPVACWLTSLSIRRGLASTQAAPVVTGGIFIWTLMEYLLHRFLFHINTKTYWFDYLSPYHFCISISFLL